MRRNRWRFASLICFTIMVALLAWLGQDHVGGSLEMETVAFNQIVDQALTGAVCRLAESADGGTVTYYRNCGEGSRPSGQVHKSNRESLLQYVQRERAVRIQQARAAGEPAPVFTMPMLAIEPLSVSSGILNALVFLLPVAVLIGGFIFVVRRLPGSNNEALHFGQRRARWPEHPMSILGNCRIDEMVLRRNGSHPAECHRASARSGPAGRRPWCGQW